MAEVPGTEPPATKVARRAFVVGIVGLPAWWVLGLASAVPLLITVPMAWDLWTRRGVRIPRHFGWWLLFLVWVVIGVGTLWATAPGTADAGGSTRILVFGFRLLWYVACTVMLLWIGNTPARLVPDRLLHRVFGSVFVVAVAGGLIGVLLPDLAVTTLAERVLPGGLRGNEFVRTLVSAEFADVQTVLGDEGARPKAPFPYTNTWGSVMALSLVYFLAAAARGQRRWRPAVLLVLAVAVVPVVLSLNRGLWLALIAAAAGVLVLAALRRHTLALAGLVGMLVFLGVAITSTPLGETVFSRLDHPHSNDRRSQLIVATIASMSEGSPAVGYGSTRDAAGTFTSIAGGATADCAACGVPPLGTQGQLWLVLFSQGWIGAAFFLTFFVLALARTVRCQTLNATVATFVVGIFLLQLTVYDTLGLPMMLVMAAVGLAWREREEGARLHLPSGPAVAVVAGTAVLGAVVALVVDLTPGDRLASTVTIALTTAPTYLDIGADTSGPEVDALADVTTTSSVDTEAALLFSERALTRAGSRSGLTPPDLRRSMTLAAPPLSTVIEVTMTTPAPRDPSTAALAVAEEYLAERQRFLDARRDDLAARLATTLASTDPLDPAWSTSRNYLRAAIDHLTTHHPEVGRVIRVSDVHRVAEDRSVPVTTGGALGGLLGVGLTAVAGQRHRRPRWQR